MFHLHPLKPRINLSESSSMDQPYDQLTIIHIILINCKNDLKFGKYLCGNKELIS